MGDQDDVRERRAGEAARRPLGSNRYRCLRGSPDRVLATVVSACRSFRRASSKATGFGRAAKRRFDAPTGTQRTPATHPAPAEKLSRNDCFGRSPRLPRMSASSPKRHVRFRDPQRVLYFDSGRPLRAHSQTVQGTDQVDRCGHCGWCGDHGGCANCVDSDRCRQLRAFSCRPQPTPQTSSG